MEQKITLSEALLERKSIREYDMAPLSDAEIKHILAYAEGIEPLMPGLKIKVTVIGPDDVKAIRGWRAPHYLALYADSDDAAMTNVCYVYEQVVIYLTSLGLGTCWANSISPKKAKELDGLKWVATIAFGWEKNGNPWRASLSETKRKDMSAISDQKDDKLEVARIAPSAMNNQPWFFTHSNGKIHVHCVIQGFMKKWMSAMNKLDVGIALAHLKLNSKNFKYEVEKNSAPKKGYSYIGTVTLQ